MRLHCFWDPWGSLSVSLGALKGNFGGVMGRLGGPWVSMGGPWAGLGWSWGVPGGSLGCLGWLAGVDGAPGGSWGGLGGGQGLPQELLGDGLGGSGAPFGEPWGALGRPWGDPGAPSETIFGKQASLQNHLLYYIKWYILPLRGGLGGLWGTLSPSSKTIKIIFVRACHACLLIHIPPRSRASSFNPMLAPLVNPSIYNPGYTTTHFGP